jgi:hypothetical protein
MMSQFTRPRDITRRDNDPDSEPDPSVRDDFEEPAEIQDPPPDEEDL